MGHARRLAAATATVFDGFSQAAQLPDFQPLDLARLRPVVSAFDRDAAGQAKREALLRVASRLFNRKGIDATSLDEIAAQVGATKRTLHHHIGSKQDLVAACYERAFRIFFLIKDRMLEHSGSRLDALAAAMHALALAYPNDEQTPLSPLVGPVRCRRKGRRHFAQLRAAGRRVPRSIRQGIEEGSIAPIDDVEARALMLPGLVSWLVKEDVPRDPGAAAAHRARGCEPRRAEPGLSAPPP